MSPDVDSLVVYAVVLAPAEDVVYAVHPTEARRQDYRPPSVGEFRRVTDELLAEDEVLQEVGVAHLREDGSYHVELHFIPSSTSLVLAPAGYRSR